ncbi:MAG: hypothetical protein ACOY90_04590 [Candidatus Zhuqueibacterota bacterium]
MPRRYCRRGDFVRIVTTGSGNLSRRLGFDIHWLQRIREVLATSLLNPPPTSQRRVRHMGASLIVVFNGLRALQRVNMPNDVR